MEVQWVLGTVNCNTHTQRQTDGCVINSKHRIEIGGAGA